MVLDHIWKSSMFLLSKNSAWIGKISSALLLSIFHSLLIKMPSHSDSESSDDEVFNIENEKLKIKNEWKKIKEEWIRIEEEKKKLNEMHQKLQYDIQCFEQKKKQSKQGFFIVAFLNLTSNSDFYIFFINSILCRFKKEAFK